MTKAMLAAILMLSVAAPVWADLTLVQNVSGKGMGMGTNTTTTTYMKGNRMRVDTVSGDTTRTMVYDVDAQKILMFDNKKKEADVWDMAAWGQQTQTSVDTSQMTASIKPNGQSKMVAGKNADGFDMSVTVPAMMGDPKNGMKMLIQLSGPVWIVKGAPGTADFLQFYKEAAEKGFIFGDPNAAKANPGQMKAMTEMYRQLAATGGVPYETEMSIKMGGDGPMAGLMAKMGGFSSTSVVQSSDVGTIDEAMFAPPVGYKLNAKK